MRFAALVSVASLTLGLSLVHAQGGPREPQGPEAPPSYVIDKSGKRDRIEYGIAVKPISNPSLTFTQFEGRRMLLFYFSALCPHCQVTAPHVQRLADELGPKGFASVAMAIQRNSEDDIRGFIRDFGLRMPMLHDIRRDFGTRYEVRTIPEIYLVNEKGEYFRWKEFHAETTPAQIRAAAAMMMPSSSK
jgi:thiol-disulfide isomerase/thioredoxin